MLSVVIIVIAVAAASFALGAAMERAGLIEAGVPSFDTWDAISLRYKMMNAGFNEFVELTPGEMAALRHMIVVVPDPPLQEERHADRTS